MSTYEHRRVTVRDCALMCVYATECTYFRGYTRLLWVLYNKCIAGTVEYVYPQQSARICADIRAYCGCCIISVLRVEYVYTQESARICSDIRVYCGCSIISVLRVEYVFPQESARICADIRVYVYYG